MLRIIDRYVLKTFFRSYVICFLSLVGLYIVIHAISNLDEFAEESDTFLSLMRNMGSYYVYNLSLFFDLLAGVITLVSAMFTVTWMKRHNEVIPLLSAGVSAYRIIFPVVVSAVLVNLGAIANQEWIMPRIADQLELDPDDPRGDKLRPTSPMIDSNGIRFYTNNKADPSQLKVANMNASVRTPAGLLSLTARNAYWLDDGQRRGWLFVDTKTEYLQEARPPYIHTWGRCLFFIESDASFDRLVRTREWYRYLSTSELWREARNPDHPRRMAMRVQFHLRVTKPLMNIILVFLGLPFVLNRYDSSVFLNLGICIVLCALFFLTMMLCQGLGQSGQLSPTIAAWLPVICFFVIAIGVFDTIKT